MKKLQILMFGAPGAGKGTQAKILSSERHIPHISTGDILREAVSKKTELGLKAKAIMEAGELVPDEIMGGIIRDVLFSDKCKPGYILDGFPRTINQANILDGILKEIDEGYPIVIELDADDELIINRLSSRRVCSECGYIVNLNSLEDPTTCPNCGAKNSFIKRKDDEEDVIKNRLNVYHQTTKPVLDFYRNKAKIISIDAALPVEEVAKKITDELN